MTRREKEVGGKQYSLLLPSAIASFAMANRVTLLIAPIIPSIIGGATGNSWAVFGTALAAADPQKVTDLFLDAARESKLTVGDIPICTDAAFNKHFDENRADLYMVCIWALWECVRDFFPQLGFQELIQKIKTRMQTELKSQQTGPLNSGSADQSGEGAAATQT